MLRLLKKCQESVGSQCCYHEVAMKTFGLWRVVACMRQWGRRATVKLAVMWGQTWTAVEEE